MYIYVYIYMYRVEAQERACFAEKQFVITKLKEEVVSERESSLLTIYWSESTLSSR